MRVEPLKQWARRNWLHLVVAPIYASVCAWFFRDPWCFVYGIVGWITGAVFSRRLADWLANRVVRWRARRLWRAKRGVVKMRFEMKAGGEE